MQLRSPDSLPQEFSFRRRSDLDVGCLTPPDAHSLTPGPIPSHLPGSTSASKLVPGGPLWWQKVL